MKKIVLGMVLLLDVTVCCGAATPLVALQPQWVLSRDPKRDATPSSMPHLQLRDRDSALVLRFIANSDVSYAIPSGSQSFSSVLAYAEVNGPQANGAINSSNRLHVSILLDGKQVFDTSMNEFTPPQEFSVRTLGAHRLTIASDQDYSWENFALVDAEFSEQRREASSFSLPADGEGYVDFMPLPRQGLFHVFRPGESVQVRAFYAGSAENARITIHVDFEQFAPDIPDFTTPVVLALRPGYRAVCEGNTAWKVPPWRGPATLDVDERVGGKTVFQHKLRIAISPDVNLAEIPDSFFGVHTSSPGFLRVQDEFASLWGAKWNRVFLRWEIVESTSGQYDFSRADAVVDSLLSQNMQVLGVIGETSPDWVGAPGPRYDEAWKRFVEQTVRHYRGKIDHWDVFNEVDVNHEKMAAGADPEFDIRLLRSAMETIHREDSQAKTICCSTGTTPWLLYDQRLFDANLLPLIDIVSLHPYELTAPEEADGVFDYDERLVALKNLVHTYGSSPPLWSTEANWILGPRGSPNVTAPDIGEHQQAQFIVRVNLISSAQSVHYFLHSPFYHSHHNELHLDSVAAYANMASLFSAANHPRSLLRGPEVYGYYWQTRDAVVGSLWTLSGNTSVTLSGVSHERILDMYGNAIVRKDASIAISSSPIYFLGSPGSSPTVKVLQPPRGPAWSNLPVVEGWSHRKESNFANVKDGVEIVSQPAKYAYQFYSPNLPVEGHACYLVTVPLNLKQGAVMLFAEEVSTRKRVGDAVYIAYIPDGRPRDARLRFFTASSGPVQLILADANLVPAVSRFQVLNPPRIAKCP